MISAKGLGAALLIPVALSAAYFGNVAQPALQTEGLVSASSKVSLRAGCFADYLYRQRFNEEFQIDGVNNPASYLQLSTEAGTVTLNFKNWCDVTAILGISQMQLDHDVFSKRQFAWGIGGTLLIYQNENIFVGLNLKYFASEQKPLYFVSGGYAYNIVSNFSMNYFEEQAGIGAAYLTKIICPYLYATYIYAKIEPRPFIAVVKMPTMDLTAPSSSSPIIGHRRWGMAIGATLIGGAKGSISVESRMFNQNALNISGEVRF